MRTWTLSLPLVLATLLLPGTTSLPWSVTKISAAWAQAAEEEKQKAEATQTVDADRLLELGREQLSANQLQAALQSLQQALRLYRKAQDRSSEGQTLKAIGNVYFALEDYARAAELAQQTLAIARDIGDRALAWRALNNLGLAHYWQEDYPQALAAYQQSLSITQTLNEREGEALVLNNLGDVYYWRGELDRAVVLQQQSLEIAQRIQNPQREFNALKSLGQAYEALGAFDSAIESYQQARAIAEALNYRPEEGTTTLGLASIYEQLSDYSQAVESYQSVLTVAQETNNPALERIATTGLGRVYQALESYPKAAEFLEQGLGLSRQLNDAVTEQSTLVLLGNVYRSLGHYEQAIAAHQQSRAIARQLNNPAAVGEVLNNLGNTYADLGQYPQALEHYQKALAIAQDIQNHSLESDVLLNLGTFYQKNLGNYLKALEFYQRSLQLPVQADTPAEALAVQRTLVTTHSGMGSVLQALGQTQRAIAAYQEGLDLARDIGYGTGEAELLNNLGTLHYQEIGAYRQAIAFYEQSLAIARQVNNPGVIGATLGNLASAYNALGNHDTALEYQQQRLTLARETQDRPGEATGLNNLGAILLRADRPSEAEQQLRQGINLMEQLRVGLRDPDKITIFEEQARTYRLLQKALIAQNQPERALEVAEQGRARAFADLLAARGSEQLATQIEAEPPTVDQIRAIAANLGATLVEYSILYETLAVEGQAAQPQASALLIWVIQPTGNIELREVDLTEQEASLADLVTTGREALGVRSRAGITVVGAGRTDPQQQARSLQQLHHLLIEPIADLLPTDPNQPLIFLPQGELFLVPFPALHQAKDAYLIQQHTILTAPSIQVLELISRHQEQGVGHRGQDTQASLVDSLPPGDVLIVGNPTMPSLPALPPDTPESLSNLPGAEQEAQEIAALFKAQAMLGDEATEEAIARRMPHARIIHLATHGLLSHGLPRESSVPDVPGAIALGPSADEDGFLTAKEILAMDLAADLVVLSACDTGRGRITGDGVIGLSRSLITAGVPSVVVSLWAVPDAPTAELMTEFYRQLQQTPDKAQALRQAMLMTKERHPDPRDWAAFTLIGEAK